MIRLGITLTLGSVVSPYVFLALAGVILFVIVVVVVGLVVTAVIGYLSKVDISRQQHDLLRHAYDEGGPGDLGVMAGAVTQIAEINYAPPVVVLADLHWGRSGDGNVDQGRVPWENNDNDLPSSGDALMHLPAETRSNRSCRKK
ncbi:MAG TPA: hypothetical protein VFA63_01835 [Pseudonocardiaceae bacterium]|jgi:hypothetical protein|nr:hypothetical protein [Pseudonocardiaceae bacterium]